MINKLGRVIFFCSVFVGQFVPCYIRASTFGHMITVNLPFRTCSQIVAYLVLQSVLCSISCTECKSYRLWCFFVSCSFSLFVIYFIEVTAEYPATSKLYPWKSWIRGERNPSLSQEMVNIFLGGYADTGWAKPQPFSRNGKYISGWIRGECRPQPFSRNGKYISGWIRGERRPQPFSRNDKYISEWIRGELDPSFSEEMVSTFLL